MGALHQALLGFKSVAAGGGVAITDSFNRADDASSLGTADSGQVWTAHGTGSILSNKGRFAALGSSPSAGLAWIDSGGSDGVLQVTFSTVNNFGLLVFRFSDVNNYLAFEGTGTVGQRILKREAGAIGSVVVFGSSAASGDVIKITLSGTSISVDKNGSLLGATTSAFNQTATKHGLGAHGNLGHRWDDFSYTP